ncbi:hypothetical protein JL720_5049 [Aureococcus anophagefferens]|nr:hypothetical protein JL720_5049 [Aureococcus anophagefferens]
MSTESPPKTYSDSPGMAVEEEVSLLRLLGLTSFMFATGLLLSTYGMITLALESTRLAPENSSFALAGFLAMAGFSQLWVSRSGQLPGVAFDDDDDASVDDDGPPLRATLVYGSFLASMLALNVAYTAATSLVPDLVPPRQTGVANGLGVFLQVLGSCFGFLYYFLVDDLDSLYALYVVVVVLFTSITLVVAVPRGSRPSDKGRGERRPLRGGEDPEAPAKPPFDWSAVLACYYVSPRDPETRDFFYVFVSRTLYYTGGSVQAFLVYYLRDRARRRLERRRRGPRAGRRHAPDAAESARFMGVWGVGAFVGVCLGPLVGAPLLYVFGRIGDPPPPANGAFGYLALFLYGSLAIFASAAVLLRYVRGAK